jgi:hypothetical protein
VANLSDKAKQEEVMQTQSKNQKENVWKVAGTKCRHRSIEKKNGNEKNEKHHRRPHTTPCATFKQVISVKLSGTTKIEELARVQRGTYAITQLVVGLRAPKTDELRGEECQMGEKVESKPQLRA